MCRSIKQLRHTNATPTDQEIYDAARQFVRKVSGYRAPSQRNQQVFEQAIEEIAGATRGMLTQFAALEQARVTNTAGRETRG